MCSLFQCTTQKRSPRGTEESFDQDNWPAGREFNHGSPRDEDGELTARPLCWVLSVTTNELTYSGTYIIIIAEEELNTRNKLLLLCWPKSDGVPKRRSTEFRLTL